MDDQTYSFFRVFLDNCPNIRLVSSRVRLVYSSTAWQRIYGRLITFDPQIHLGCDLRSHGPVSASGHPAPVGAGRTKWASPIPAKTRACGDSRQPSTPFGVSRAICLHRRAGRKSGGKTMHTRTRRALENRRGSVPSLYRRANPRK